MDGCPPRVVRAAGRAHGGLVGEPPLPDLAGRQGLGDLVLPHCQPKSKQHLLREKVLWGTKGAALPRWKGVVSSRTTATTV